MYIIYVYKHVSIYMHKYTCTPTYMCIHAHIYTQTYILYMYRYINIYPHTRTYPNLNPKLETPILKSNTHAFKKKRKTTEGGKRAAAV